VYDDTLFLSCKRRLYVWWCQNTFIVKRISTNVAVNRYSNCFQNKTSRILIAGFSVPCHFLSSYFIRYLLDRYNCTTPATHTHIHQHPTTTKTATTMHGSIYFSHIHQDTPSCTWLSSVIHLRFYKRNLATKRILLYRQSNIWDYIFYVLIVYQQKFCFIVFMFFKIHPLLAPPNVDTSF